MEGVMKRKLLVIVMFVAPAFFLAAGSAPAQQSTCTVTVRPDTFTVREFGQTVEATVTASSPECPFTVTTRFPWISVSPSAGKGSAIVKIKAEGNLGLQQRVGEVKVDDYAVSIVQPGAPKLDR
jgi:hypothetical protein